MSNTQNKRDVQFRGFAKALMSDLETVSTTAYASIDKGKEAYERTVARWAYDLVEHTLEHAPLTEYEGRVEDIPDMPELPKEQEP